VGIISRPVRSLDMADEGQAVLRRMMRSRSPVEEGTAAGARPIAQKYALKHRQPKKKPQRPGPRNGLHHSLGPLRIPQQPFVILDSMICREGRDILGGPSTRSNFVPHPMARILDEAGTLEQPSESCRVGLRQKPRQVQGATGAPLSDDSAIESRQVRLPRYSPDRPRSRA